MPMVSPSNPPSLLKKKRPVVKPLLANADVPNKAKLVLAEAVMIKKGTLNAAVWPELISVEQRCYHRAVMTTHCWRPAV